MLRSIALALSLAAAPLAAHAQPAQDANAAPDQREGISRALARGKLIYAYDQAAWHGTDDMLAKVQKPEEKIGGWIVDGPASAPTIIFFDRDKADPHAVYVAEFNGTRLTSSRVLGPNDDRSLSPQRKAMIAARAKGIEAWIAAKPLFCSKRSPNTVVLPPERPGGPFLVYVLTPQTENDAYPFGGHFLVEVGADGHIGASRSFSRSCLTVPNTGEGKTAAMFITHLLDPIPTEIHVFTALAANVPVAVAVPNDSKDVWWVTGDSITSAPLN